MSRILSYVIGAVVSAVLHVGVIVALWANWQPSSETVYLQPKYVVAELVQLAPRAPAVSKEKKTSATSDQLARKKKRQVRGARTSNAGLISGATMLKRRR